MKFSDKSRKLLLKRHPHISLHTESDEAMQKILNTTSNSVIVIQNSGIIKYVNPATETVMGSSKTVGLNIFNFITVKSTLLENVIHSAFAGSRQELNSYQHISATTKEEKYLNITLTPFLRDLDGKVKEVLMVSTDVSTVVKLTTRLQANFLATFQSLASIIDARDSYTGKHSSNVHFYTAMILKGLDLSEELASDILTAAMLHDIGKVGISDDILKKVGSLEQWEYEIMKGHSATGAELLVGIEQFNSCSYYVRHHHERWDGHGYPDGLIGGNIPIGAQIICIADAFDAMTSERVYRKARSMKESIIELNDNRWKQFNGNYVDIFTKILEKYDSLSDLKMLGSRP